MTTTDDLIPLDDVAKVFGIERRADRSAGAYGWFVEREIPVVVIGKKLFTTRAGVHQLCDLRRAECEERQQKLNDDLRACREAESRFIGDGLPSPQPKSELAPKGRDAMIEDMEPPKKAVAESAVELLKASQERK